MKKNVWGILAMLLAILLPTLVVAQDSHHNPEVPTVNLVENLIELRSEGATEEDLNAFAEIIINAFAEDENDATLASHEDMEYCSFPPGDPRCDGLNVSDVSTALRWAVGLYDSYSYGGRNARDERYAYDVAPTAIVGEWQSCETCDALEYVENTYALGDGKLDVADVVALLRAAVGLQDLTWPRRHLTYSYEGGSWARPFDGYHIMWNFEWRHLGTPLITEVLEHTGIAMQSWIQDSGYNPQLNQVVLFDDTVPIVQSQTFPVIYGDTLLGSLSYIGPHMWGRENYHPLKLAGPRQGDEFEGTESFWGTMKYRLRDSSLSGDLIQETTLYGGGKG